MTDPATTSDLSRYRDRIATEIMGYRKDEHGNYSEWAEAK